LIGGIICGGRRVPDASSNPSVHRDGSITFAGVKYPSIRQVPPECKALRVDVDTYVQWKSLYRAIDPKARRARQ
jgi:hypothetical protein